MQHTTRSLIGGALLLMALSACGQQPASDTPTSGMDHGGMSAMSAAPSAASSAAGAAHGTMSDMHSEAPYDARFIDSMIAHHAGAIAMAEEALEQSERAEIQQLARTIIDDQQAEIEQMQRWRAEWYPDLAPTAGIDMPMGDMSVGADADQPYDQRFITAMIAHHEGAIAMARDAQTNAQHSEIRQLAAAIIAAQEAEIAQMMEWRTAWFDG